MGLKILHSADWHLDSPFAGFSADRREFLRREQKKLPGKIARLCRGENCDLVLLSGDIFDNPTCRESGALLRDALAECRVPVIIAPGNHDYITAGSPWLDIAWPENVHIFTGALESIVLPGLDCRVYGAGYRSMDCDALLENFRAEGPERYQICVLHGDPMRLHSPYCPVTTAQVRDSGLDYLALGHIHREGSFRAGSTLCCWPGTPMGRGFDEQGEKGVYILELDGTCTGRFVALDTPRFFELNVDTDIQAPEQLLPGVDSGDFYRVTLTGGGEGSLADIRRKCPRLRHLELIDRREPGEDPFARIDEDTLEGTYFRMLKEKLDAAEAGQEEIIRLAARISKTLLDGREVTL